MSLTKRPLCGRCDHGWVYDESTDPPTVTPCPCRSTATPEGERDAALTGTADANPQAMKAALLIIRDTAKAMPVFSGNDTRSQMRHAQIPGPVVGAAFRQALKDRVIRRTGYVPSDDLGTHGHPIAEYQSVIYGQFGRTA